MDQPTEEERLGFVKSYGVEPVTDINTDLTFKDAATAVAEMTPIIGDAMAAKEVYDELIKDEPNYGLIAALGGAALVGAVPGIGDAAAAGIRKAVDVAKRVEVDPDAVGMMGGNIRLKPKPKEEDYLTLDNPNYKELRGQVDETSDIKAAETLLDATEEDIAEVRKGQSKNRKQEEAGKRPFAEEAQALEKNEITGKEFREKAFADVEKFTELEELPTFTEIVFALDKNKRAKGIIGLEKSMAQGAKKIAAGDRVMARLDIPAYNNYDVYVPQITFKKEGVKGAESVFSRTMVIEDVKFPTPQKPSFDIARGKENKFPHATINGQVASNPASKKMYTDQEAHDLAKSVFDDPDFVHVGYNPDRGGFFYDRETNMPVFDSPLVVQIGKQIFAKRSGETSAERVAKMRKMDLRKTSPDIKKPTLFSEGGMALEEQMAMNFGDVPDNTIGIDPVSGNEIPLGSTAENVRDDIPANLSEGEIVIPADVVNYWGVKLFEDLRAQAKMGYAQMAQDGRIGGEPMEDATSGIGIEISLSDLDVVEDDGTEDAFLGKFFAGIRDANRKAREERDKQKVRDIFKAAANKDKDTKTKHQTQVEKMMAAFRDDSDQKKPRRPKLKEKPPTSDDAPGPSIAEQINFGGDYGNTTPTKKAGKVSGAYKARQTQSNNETQNVRYYDQGFIERLLEGLGFDEGGLVEGDLELEEDVEVEEEQPRKVYEKKGGFDMRTATRVPDVQIYTYENAEGHRIHITYIDGVPQSEIPPGYVQVGDPVNVNTGDAEDTPAETTEPTDATDGGAGATPASTGTSGGGSSSNDNDSGSSAPAPEPVNYKELTMAELTKMIEDQKNMKGNLLAAGISALNPMVGGAMKLAMWNETRLLKAELQRRRDDPSTSEVDKIRYDQLLEIANRDEPGLIATLFGKLTGKGEEGRTQAQTDALYNQLDKMTKAYTPDTQTSSTYKVPNPTKTAAEQIQDEIDIKRIEDEMKSQPRPMDDDTFDAMGGYDGSNEDDDDPYVPPTYTPDATKDALDNQTAAEDAMGRNTSYQSSVSTPTVRGDSLEERDAQRRRDRQESNKNISNTSTSRKTGVAKSATRGLGSSERKGGSELDSRFGITGINKGALVTKKRKKKKSK